ncbi:MAG: hypothetical protein ACO3O1_06000, partial [Ilumatobacteraceae bacterium]
MEVDPDPSADQFGGIINGVGPQVVEGFVGARTIGKNPNHWRREGPRPHAGSEADGRGEVVE